MTSMKEDEKDLQTVTLVLTNSPYGDEKVWNALRLARSLISVPIKMKVNIFLLGDAVTTAKKGQKTPEGYYNLEKMLDELIKLGVKVLVCGTCINSRGLTKGELLDGVELGTMTGLAAWIKEAHKVISF